MIGAFTCRVGWIARLHSVCDRMFSLRAVDYRIPQLIPELGNNTCTMYVVLGSLFLLLLISSALHACNILITSYFRAQYTRNLLPCDLATSHNGKGTPPSNYKLGYVAYKPRAHEPRAGRGGLISPIGRPDSKSKPHEKWISREGGAERRHSQIIAESDEVAQTG